MATMTESGVRGLPVSTETTRLLSRSHSTRSRVVAKPKKRFRYSYLSPHRVCIYSRAVALIFAWTFVNGAIYKGLTTTINIMIYYLEQSHKLNNSSVHTITGVYFILALANIFYPLAGFIADAWCGRYRVVLVSLCLLWVCLFLATVLAIIAPPIITIYIDYLTKEIFVWILWVLTFGLCTAALAGFYSNVVQLGFDQLLDEPSRSLGMFVHWFIWFETLGISVVYTLNTVVECAEGNKQIGVAITEVLHLSPSPFLIILSFLLVISFFTRKYFYTERVQKNPYKLILSILNFARKNKYPVSPPSAFVYTYHRKPSRLDFAKEVYGGPFKNSDVDDVRTFIRVLFILLALGPIFILQVPVSYTVFPIFGQHTGTDLNANNSTCSFKWVIFESGTLSFILFILFFPVYFWFVYSVLRNRIPKILTRLGFASILFILAVVSMLAIDLSGHLALYSKGDQTMTCMFLQPYHGPYQPLYLSWWVLVLPNAFMAFAPYILLATALEFICAQGPHLMKGVLVGILFAIKGFYQLVGASLVQVFIIDAWKEGTLKHLASMISCEFGYFLVTVLIALIGFICFVVCARKYKYRVRGEEGFSQSDVEEVFERRLRQEQEHTRRLGEEEMQVAGSSDEVLQ